VNGEMASDPALEWLATAMAVPVNGEMASDRALEWLATAMAEPETRQPDILSDNYEIIYF